MVEAGIRKSQDVTNNLHTNKIKLSSKQLHNFIENIKNNINPFSKEIDKENLYNISSGQAVNINVSNFLLSLEKVGDEQRQAFIEECSKDAYRFEKSFKRNKILNFTSDFQKKKLLCQERLSKFVWSEICLANYYVFRLRNRY